MPIYIFMTNHHFSCILLAVNCQLGRKMGGGGVKTIYIKQNSMLMFILHENICANQKWRKEPLWDWIKGQLLFIGAQLHISCRDNTHRVNCQQALVYQQPRESIISTTMQVLQVWDPHIHSKPDSRISQTDEINWELKNHTVHANTPCELNPTSSIRIDPQGTTEP